MKGLKHRWLAPTGTADAPQDATSWGRGFDPLLVRVLAARGITDRASAEIFCNPRLTQLHSPALMPGLERAAERLLKAVRGGEQVVIYGDYDVDGVSAAAILWHMLRAVAGGAASAIRTYIPHRLDEGYGLHTEAIKQLCDEGARVIVSVDCGVTAFEPALAAKRAGVDLIITDHHTLPHQAALDGAGLPEAYAVVHPRLPGSRYPWGELCGAGVAFKLAWRIATMAQGSERVDDAMRALLLEMLALAGLGTIADVVPLLDENRVIARYGLDHLKRCSNTGVRALIEASGLAGENIDSQQAGFALAPRLNACGRMGHAREALELFTTADAGRATEIAKALNKFNVERKATENAIFERACAMAVERGMDRPDRRAIVLAHPQWHAGVVGIVCSRMVERFHRPTILLAQGESSSHGSGRSIDGYNLHAGIASGADLVEKFGGHEMAAGMVVANDRLDAFVERFTTHANAGISEEMLVSAMRFDCEAAIGEMTESAVRAIDNLGPFGRSNPRPTIVIRGVKALREPQSMGSSGAHLSMNVGQGAGAMRLVGWRWGERKGAIRAGQRLDVAIHPTLNQWNGRTSVEGEICDVAVSGAG